MSARPRGKKRAKKRMGESKIVLQYRQELSEIRDALNKERENPMGKDEAVHNADVRELRMAFERARIQLAQAILADQITEKRDMTSLDLQSRGFTEVPDAVSALSNLTDLDISFNIVRDLNEDFDLFGSLRHLRVFRAVQNELLSLPESIRHCRDLRVLDLRWNFLQTLPQALFESCTQLTELLVSYNQLSELPPTLTNLRSLKILKLDVNRMPIIPPLSGMDALEVLAMSKMGTYEEKKPGTKREKIKRTKFSSLPKDIEQCMSLTELYAVNNQIKEIPSALCESLTRLKKLHLNGNRIAELPQSFSNLANLVECDLSRNRLTRASFQGLNLQDLISPPPTAGPNDPQPFFSIENNIGINTLDDIIETGDQDDVVDDADSDNSDE